MYWLQIIVIGVATGCIYALAGLGVVLTYKATGIFNFAHGAIGVFVAYVLWQLNADWGIPLGIAAPIALLLVGPGVGLLLERVVFRPLQRGGASTTEKLVATLGVFVLLLGVVITIWTSNVKVGPHIFSPRGITLVESGVTEEGRFRDGLIIGYDDLGIIFTVAVVSLALWALFRFTHLGTEIRAVVDKPELAELASINANRVSGIAWAMGAGLAGLSGVLFAAGSLSPFQLTLFLLESLAVAVLARLTNLPLAVAAGVLVLGVGRALFQETEIFNATGTLGESWEFLKPSFGTMVLFAAILLYRRLDTVGDAADQRAVGFVRGTEARRRAKIVGAVIAGGLVILPTLLDDNGFDSAHRFLAMTVIFASIVTVTGFSGQITLGQAGFAGLGAFISAKVADGLDVPVLVAMLVGGAVAFVAGVIAGYPALRRRGLFLALTTLAFGMVIFYGVLANDVIAGDVTGLEVRKPTLFGLSLDGPLAFYYYELAVVGLMLLLARNIRSGRLGRALAAMRDSETGASSVGIDLRRYKVFIFAVSAFMAGIGGAMLTQQAETFRGIQFFPIESLFWFAVVVVAGVGTVSGAVLGAFVFVMLEVVIDVAGLSQLVIGAGALLLGRLPGGSLSGMLRVALDRVVDSGRRSLADARRTDPGPAPARYEPTELALRALAEPVPVPGASQEADR